MNAASQSNQVSTMHQIPDDALESDIAIIARKGSGKSYLARGLAERLLDLRRRVMIIDPLGAWWGLRSSADGERPGYAVAVFGGEHADMPLTSKMGDPLAKLIAGDNLPCVIDTSLMRKEEQGELAIDLFEGLFRHNREALTIILEEADVFAPQNPAKDGYASRVLHEVDRIARRGRARGLRLISLTQRPARLHKDVLSQAATMVAMRLSAPQDREAIKAWVEGNADRDQAREVIDSLASLPVGSGWVWAPDLDLLTKAKFPPIKTLDTSATPKAGESRVEPKTLADVDVTAIREALAAADESPAPKAASRDKSVPDPAALAQAEDRGYRRGLDDGMAQGRIAGIAIGIERARKALDGLQTEDGDHGVPVTPIRDSTKLEAPVGAASAPRNRPARTAGGDDPLLTAALSVWPARLTWAVLAAMCGRKARGGHFNSVRKSLLDGGLVRMDGDLVTPTSPPDQPEGAVPADLLERNLPQPAAKMFMTIRTNPGISVAGLSDLLGMQPRGGHWNFGMATLRRNGLIEERGDALSIPEDLLG